jgi:putative DNA primase/helicase
MTATEIAAVLGNARREGRGWRCICPLHGGCSLTLRDGHSRLLVRCWVGCDTRAVLAELRRLQLLNGAGAVSSAGRRIDDLRDRERRIEIARRIWDAARDARGTPVVRYLANRGITTPLPPSLRYAPRCRHPSGIWLPAMVARIDNIDGELIGLHRTFLRPDGCGKADIKLQKAMLGRASGGAVRLAPAAEMLLIAEGVETTLAGMVATGLPGWAALSTSGMTALLLPPIVRTVIVLADHDINGAGQRAARIAEARWRLAGRRVSVWMSPRPGEDVNDCLLTAPNPESRGAAA